MFVVVEQLVFVADRTAFALIRDEIFQAAVAAVGDAPFPREFKLGKLGCGNEVAAAALGEVMEPAVLNVPAFVGCGGFFEIGPAGEGFAIEEQFPAAGFFGVSQGVGIRGAGGGGERGDGEEQRQRGGSRKFETGGFHFLVWDNSDVVGKPDTHCGGMGRGILLPSRTYCQRASSC